MSQKRTYEHYPKEFKEEAVALVEQDYLPTSGIINYFMGMESEPAWEMLVRVGIMLSLSDSLEV